MDIITFECQWSNMWYHPLSSKYLFLINISQSRRWWRVGRGTWGRVVV